MKFEIWDAHTHLSGVAGETPEDRLGKLLEYAERLGIARLCVFMGMKWSYGFFAGRWPVREFGLTQMDYTKHHTPEAEAILQTGIRITIHEGMTEDYIVESAVAIRKVAQHFKA